MKRTLVILLCALVLGGGATFTHAQDGYGSNRGEFDPERPVGLTVNTGEAAAGYIVMPVLQSKSVWLLSNDGRIVKTWGGEHFPANMVYMLDDGSLVRTNHDPEAPFGPEGPWTYVGGRLERVSFEGEQLWEIVYSSERYVPHHDIEVLPNGNVLVLVFDRYFADQVLAAGRDPQLMPADNQIFSEKIVEIDPSTGEVVWEWKVWDHLVQDYDPDLPNYGDPAENPGRFDINYVGHRVDADWLHWNSVEYHAERDEIFLSSKVWSEVYIIDHSLSTEEAAGPAGDLLYRWGNPEAYSAGTNDDQQLHDQHDPQWIPEGYPGAGNVLIFDNGHPDEREYSRVVEIELPLDEDGNYIMQPGQPTGPAAPVWEWRDEPQEDFFSRVISGAQRQPNGNTLITAGDNGIVFEVNPAGEVVWEYYLPHGARVFRAQRYDLPVFEGMDQGQDLSEEIGFGDMWIADCADESQFQLRAYLSNDRGVMELFRGTHGEAAAQNWQEEVCAEHEGLLEAAPSE